MKKFKVMFYIGDRGVSILKMDGVLTNDENIFMIDKIETYFEKFSKPFMNDSLFTALVALNGENEFKIAKIRNHTQSVPHRIEDDFISSFKYIFDNEEGYFECTSNDHQKEMVSRECKFVQKARNSKFTEWCKEYSREQMLKRIDGDLK